MSSPRKIRVAVVFGGQSPEHSISAVSAGSILSALDPDEFEVVPVGITRDGRWVLTSSDPRALAIQGGRLPEITAGSGTTVVLPGDPTSGGLIVLDPAEGARALGSVDVVFPALHGQYGEDGSIQGLLEMAGVPYVGANVFASAAGMDKDMTKRLAASAGIPVGPYVALRSGTVSEADRARLGLPAFVKPARAGSSYGISKIKSWDELDTAIAHAQKIDPKVIVEAAIVGREIECGVLEGEVDGAPEASELAEIRIVRRDHEFYDFEAKYLEDACEFDIPAVLPERVTQQIKDYACRTFSALDCAGLARVDFFVTPDYEVFLNEINTMPGFTAMSMFPRMWAASGLDYPKLVSRLIRTALRRGTGLH